MEERRSSLPPFVPTKKKLKAEEEVEEVQSTTVKVEEEVSPAWLDFLKE